MTVRSWQADQRQLSIGRGAASYLEVHENYNPGWAATLNGQQLTPVRLDGWQQAFVVPAGAGGTVTLSFRPAATYHLVLVASLLAVALLLALTAWSFTGRGTARDEGSADAASPGPGSTGPMGVAPYRFFPAERAIHWFAGRRAGSTPGTVGMRGIGATRNERRRRGRAWLGVLGVTALAFVAGGPVAFAVPVLAWLAWRPPRPPGRPPPGAWLPWVAFAGLLASGLLSAVRPFGEGLFGPFGWPAQACALVALAAALTPAAARPTAATAGEEDG